MLFNKQTNSQKYIQRIIKNRYGYPSQIIPINNEVGILLGTFVRERSWRSAEYGVWLISLDFMYHSEGLAGFTRFVPRENIGTEFQRMMINVNQAITVLKAGDAEGIDRNYIARFLHTELIKYEQKKRG